MIISHRHRFIFIAVPRTATHAIRAALQPHLANDDWEQKLLHGEKRIPIPEIAALKHGHVSCRQIKPCLDGEVWNSYFKFAFVRNPYDRFISACFFLNRRNPGFRGKEIRTMKQLLAREDFRRRILIQPQAVLLTDDDNHMGLDYIGRFETLQESFDDICERIGIPAAALSNLNTSHHREYRDYYDPELRQAVTDLYRDDLRLFGYNGDDTGTA